ncbi:MAG TPA: hypothetical protein VHP62_09160 [Usitatibacter sp.]|jgi:hypothetical protein|nr:hypothetical protein [Usitatibacter sp.]
MRPAILFVAIVVMATATFSDANAWIEPLPAMRQLPIAARVALLYVPYAILVAILWFYARVQSRVQGNIAWFIALAIFAVGTILTPYVTPALMLAIALVLLKLSPRLGFLYEATSFPSIRAFLGFTLLAAMSIKWGADLFGMELLLENLQSVPLDAVGAAVCAVAAGVLIAGAKLRYRRVQPCGAATWLTAGILTCAGGALAAHLPSKIPYGFYASAGLLIAAHLMLFVGSFLLLSHLLPYREADRKF